MIRRTVPLVLATIVGIVVLTRLSSAHEDGTPPANPPPTLTPPPADVSQPRSPGMNVLPTGSAPGVKPPGSPGGESVDQLVDRIAAVQAQRAELEKVEAQLKALLEKKLTEQQERLKKIGLKSPGPGKIEVGALPEIPTPTPPYPTVPGRPK